MRLHEQSCNVWKSSHQAEVGRHEGSYCIESEAFVARIGSIESIGVSRGEISFGVQETTIEATKGRMSSGNWGTRGSPYASQRAIQTLWGKLAIRRGAKDSLVILLYIKRRREWRYSNEGTIFEYKEGNTSLCSLQWPMIKALHFW